MSLPGVSPTRSRPHAGVTFESRTDAVFTLGPEEEGLLRSARSRGAGRLWRRRDRPGDFSIKSTKVQSFDDAITGTKRPKSLHSANAGNRAPSPPRMAEQGALLRTTADHANVVA